MESVSETAIGIEFHFVNTRRRPIGLNRVRASHEIGRFIIASARSLTVAARRVRALGKRDEEKLRCGVKPASH